MTVVGIVTKENKILIGKLFENKVSEFGGIQYVFPGGKVEGNETPEQAVAREIKEEAGVEVKVTAKIAARIHPKTSQEIHYFHCEYLSGKLDLSNKDNNDIEELLWVDLTELEKYVPTVFAPVRLFLKLSEVEE